MVGCVFMLFSWRLSSLPALDRLLLSKNEIERTGYIGHEKFAVERGHEDDWQMLAVCVISPKAVQREMSNRTR